MRFVHLIDLKRCKNVFICIAKRDNEYICDGFKLLICIWTTKMKDQMKSKNFAMKKCTEHMEMKEVCRFWKSVPKKSMHN